MQPAFLPARTSETMSPIIHERDRSRPRSMEARRSIPGAGLRSGCSTAVRSSEAGTAGQK